MYDFLQRTEALLGKEKLRILSQSHVLVLGLGGVGCHAVEALSRSGIGTISLVDPECYEKTNCNRQLFATTRTLGLQKVFVAEKRILEINPQCKVFPHAIFFDRETPDSLFDNVDYILDAIDSVPSKVEVVCRAKKLGIPIISCMGTGNKLDPTEFRVADLFCTKVCPLARVMRTELKKRGIDRLKTVYSEELPKKSLVDPDTKKHIPTSISFVPGVAGMILAGEIIKDLTEICL